MKRRLLAVLVLVLSVLVLPASASVAAAQPAAIHRSASDSPEVP